MLIITTAVIIAVVIVGIMLTSHRSDESQLSEPRVAAPVVGIQIVCGNCAGDEFRPRRTYLDRYGNCVQCGGHSYLLASSVYGSKQAKQEVESGERVTANARVLAFDPARVNKIAV